MEFLYQLADTATDAPLLLVLAIMIACLLWEMTWMASTLHRAARLKKRRRARLRYRHNK